MAQRAQPEYIGGHRHRFAGKLLRRGIARREQAANVGGGFAGQVPGACLLYTSDVYKRQTLKNAYDPYTFVRDAYLQRRAYLISDGKVTESPLEDPDAGLPPDDDPADAQKTPPQPEKH